MTQKKREVPPSIFEAARRNQADNTLQEAVDIFIKLCGGAKGFAEVLHQEFTAARPGSLMRQRIMDMVMRVWRFQEEKNGPQLEDLGMLSAADIEAQLKSILERAMGDAEEETNTEPAANHGQAGADVLPDDPAGGAADPTATA